MKKVFLFLVCASILPFMVEGVMEKTARIYVAGHNGLVGSALMRKLRSEGYIHIITRTLSQLDLRNQKAVQEFFEHEKPEYVFLAAAKVGGIKANIDSPATFLYDNLLISANIIHMAHKTGVKKVLFLGSSCIYPRNCAQPMKEEYLLTDALEPTNEPYAIAKIAGIKLCQAYNRQYGTRFISCMPTNVYGPHDNFDLHTSHVLPALIKKIYTAQQSKKPHVTVWGTGTPYREFLYVDDLADALVFLMNNYESSEIVNVGTGRDISIADLARTIKEVIGYTGTIVFDPSMPDGTPRKLLDVSRLAQLGWVAPTALKEGIKKTVNWCIKQKSFNF